MSTRSTNRSFKKLMMVNKVLPRDIYKSLCAQRVELVFTSHPTQAFQQEQHISCVGLMHVCKNCQYHVALTYLRGVCCRRSQCH